MRWTYVSHMVVLFLLFGLAGNAQVLSKDEPLRLSGLQNTYRHPNKVNLHVESTSAKPQRFTCTIEGFVDQQWRDVTYSCFADDPVKTAREVQLRPSEVTTISWNTPPGKSTLASAQFRFRFDFYTEEASEPSFSIYSQPFEVLWN